MSERKILKKLLNAKGLEKHPDLAAKIEKLTNETAPSVHELARLLLVVLNYLKKVDKMVKEGALKGDKGDTPQPDKDYLSLETAERGISMLFEKAVTEIKKDIKNGEDGRDGVDAEVTDEQIQEAAERAYKLIQLPEWETLITAEPTAIRDALELLQEDERLDMKAVRGLTETIEEFRVEVNQSGGISPNAVQGLINRSIAALNLGSMATESADSYAPKTGWSLTAQDEVTLSFTDGTRTFSIAPVGASFEFFVQGTKYTYTTAQTVTIDDTEGIWFIYFDNTGTLVATQTVWNIEEDNKALVAVIYWDADNNKAVGVGLELHTWTMDAATHARLHLTEGSAYSSGFALGNMSTDGTGNDAANAQLSVGDGVFFDEDIKHTIEDDSPQQLSTVAEIPILYRSGATGVWRKVDATQYPVTTAGTGRAAWNEWTGATWQLTEVTNLDFVLMHLFATNDITEPIIAIAGQAEYTKIGDAQTGAETEIENLSFGQLAGLTPEFVPLATVIFQTSTGYANAVKSKIVTTAEGADYIDWRASTGSRSAISGVTDHGNLTGLADDDHEQYSLISSQAGAPTSTPTRVGEVNIDITNDTVYVSVDTASSADWKKVSDIDLNGLTDVTVSDTEPSSPSTGDFWVDIS